MNLLECVNKVLPLVEALSRLIGINTKKLMNIIQKNQVEVCTHQKHLISLHKGMDKHSLLIRLTQSKTSLKDILGSGCLLTTTQISLLIVAIRLDN
ncbi:hypothetical protein CR513_17640, partial [Mucuna pruriens]